jgi:6-phosphofructokinase 1
MSDKFIKYALPLIAGETDLPKEDGLPRFVNLKKVLVKK